MADREHKVGRVLGDQASAKEPMFSIDRDRMENENLGAGNLQWDVELFRLLESTPRDSLCVIAT